MQQYEMQQYNAKKLFNLVCKHINDIEILTSNVIKKECYSVNQNQKHVNTFIRLANDVFKTTERLSAQRHFPIEDNIKVVKLLADIKRDLNHIKNQRGSFSLFTCSKYWRSIFDNVAQVYGHLCKYRKNIVESDDTTQAVYSFSDEEAQKTKEYEGETTQPVYAFSDTSKTKEKQLSTYEGETTQPLYAFSDTYTLDSLDSYVPPPPEKNIFQNFWSFLMGEEESDNTWSLMGDQAFLDY